MTNPDREELVKPRKHYFVPSDDDFDTCARCGKNIRNDEHCSNTERPETDAEYIARLESALRRLAEAGTQEAVLCCDVRLPPITTIRAGCKVSTLMAAISMRESWPEEDRHFIAPPPAVVVKGEPEPVAWADKYSETHPITAESKKVLSNNPTTEPYWSRFSIPLYTAQPADAGMREALAYAERLAVVLWSKHFKDSAPNWKPLTGDLIGLLTQIDNMTSALTSPGATTKSDGGLTPNATTIAAIEELERGGGEVIGGPSPIPFNGYGEYTPITVRGSTSDPSSTRSEVTVESLADWLNKRGSLIAKAALSNPGRHSTIDLAHALLDQFEIRRK